MMDNIERVYFVVLSDTNEFLAVMNRRNNAPRLAYITAKSDLDDFYSCQLGDDVSAVRQRILEKSGRVCRAKSHDEMEALIHTAQVMADWWKDSTHAGS